MLVTTGNARRKTPQTTTFLVREPFRGVDAQKVELNTGAGICTYPFIVGQSYLVFANRYKGELYTDICTEACAEVMASALLQQLRAKGSGQQMASLFGSVLLAPKDAYERRGEVHCKPQSDVAVRIDDGKGNQFATTTEGEGAYLFGGFPLANTGPNASRSTALALVSRISICGGRAYCRSRCRQSRTNGGRVRVVDVGRHAERQPARKTSWVTGRTSESRRFIRIDPVRGSTTCDSSTWRRDVLCVGLLMATVPPSRCRKESTATASCL